jgi:hypothetical protein
VTTSYPCSIDPMVIKRLKDVCQKIVGKDIFCYDIRYIYSDGYIDSPSFTLKMEFEIDTTWGIEFKKLIELREVLRNYFGLHIDGLRSYQKTGLYKVRYTYLILSLYGKRRGKQ